MEIPRQQDDPNLDPPKRQHATEVTYQGLTHTCDDPACHVPDFVRTLGIQNSGIGEYGVDFDHSGRAG